MTMVTEEPRSEELPERWINHQVAKPQGDSVTAP